MEAFFVSVVSAIIVNVCLARISYNGGSSYSSLGSSITAVIVVPIVVGTFIFVVILLCCLKKCGKRQKMGVLPLSTQSALAQQENLYAPPSYNQLPPYDQPPPYGYPPPYSSPSAPPDPTKATLRS